MQGGRNFQPIDCETLLHSFQQTTRAASSPRCPIWLANSATTSTPIRPTLARSSGSTPTLPAAYVLTNSLRQSTSGKRCAARHRNCILARDIHRKSGRVNLEIASADRQRSASRSYTRSEACDRRCSSGGRGDHKCGRAEDGAIGTRHADRPASCARRNRRDNSGCGSRHHCCGGPVEGHGVLTRWGAKARSFDS
jgi:hypothetical protein